MNESQATPPATERFQGEVAEILYRKAGSEWGVLRAREASSGEERVITGLIGPLAPGNFIEAKGQWVQGRRGKEFKASFIRNELPASPAGIINFLSSGAFMGIGQVTAERLVGAFGSETLHVILESPDRVAKVHGVGLRKARALQDALLPMRMEAPVLADLRSIMGEARAQKAVQLFGGQAAAMIKENPYGFSGKIPGFGFKTADEVAIRGGMDRKSPRRLHAAATWALKEAEDHGHCALPLATVEKKVARLTDVDLESVQREHLDTALGTAVAVEMVNGVRYLAQRETAQAEKRVADELRRRAARHIDPSRWGQIDQRIAAAERARGVRLDWRQRTGVRQALLSPVSVITGFPGTGKSAALGVLTDVIGGDKVTLAAPTGKAARRMREATGLASSTLHSLLGYNPRTSSFAFDAKVKLPVSFVAVDESSMLDIFLDDALLQALPDDAPLLMMGDVDQLPSVGAGNVLADVILSNVVPVTRFENVYRQGAGSAILQNARLVNRGQAPDFSGMSREFRFIEANTAEEAQRLVFEQVRTVMPKCGYDIRRDVQVLVAMNKGPVGVDALNEGIQSIVPATGAARLQTPGVLYRVGDKVIQMKNDYDAGVFNGDMGFVESIDEKKSKLAVRFEDRLVDYTGDRLRNIRPAWAMSIHRSQGSEYPVVIMAFAAYNAHMLDRQILYTGMTRAKSELVLVGPRRLIETAVAAQPKGVRHTLLRWRLQQSGVL